MSNKQFFLQALLLLAGMFGCIYWLASHVDASNKGYFTWVQKCEQSGGRVIRDSSNTFCMYGRLEPMRLTEDTKDD